jgi:hypothetical protein
MASPTDPLALASSQPTCANVTVSGVYLLRAKDKIVQLFDAVDGMNLWTTEYGSEGCFTYCPSANKVFALDYADGICAWDLTSGNYNNKRRFGDVKFCGHYRVNSAGTRLLMNKEVDDRLYEWSVWDVDGETRLYVLGRSSDMQPMFAWNDSRIIYITDHSLVVADADTGVELFSEMDENKYFVEYPRRTWLSPSEGGGLVCVGTGRSLFVIDLADCSYLPFQQCFLSTIKSVCFSDGVGSIAVLEEKGEQLSCWSLPEGTLLFRKPVSTISLSVGWMVVSPGTGAFCCMIAEERAHHYRGRQYDAMTGDEIGCCSEFELPIVQLIASRRGNILM